MAVLSPVFSCFFGKMRNPPRASARAVAQRKTRRGMPPRLLRSFGEYALLEDSRYTSQAENCIAIKPLNQQGIVGLCSEKRAKTAAISYSARKLAARGTAGYASARHG